jgi:hypothetical protein
MKRPVLRDRPLFFVVLNTLVQSRQIIALSLDKLGGMPARNRQKWNISQSRYGCPAFNFVRQEISFLEESARRFFS